MKIIKKVLREGGRERGREGRKEGEGERGREGGREEEGGRERISPLYMPTCIPRYHEVLCRWNTSM